MKKLVIGWVGNYRRVNKRFDIAKKYCDEYGHTLRVAGPPNTELHIPHEQMPTYYRKNHVLLSTSVEEAHPLAIYESLSCEVPVAMLDVGDCSTEELEGILYYDYLDAKMINDCIIEIMENRETHGKAGRESILKKWQWKHWIPSYVKMFQEVSGKKKGINIVITVDKPAWAWDIMARILIRELPKTGLFGKTHIAYTKGVDPDKVLHIKNLRLGKYDAMLNHTWQAYNHSTKKDFRDEINIPCANGAAYLSRDWESAFNRIANRAGAITTVSRVIEKDLRERFGNKRIYHCSRGVDTEFFKP